MELFPIFANLNGRHVLVVGGGQVALRKAQLLLGASAWVTVGAPALCEAMRRLAESGSVRWIQGEYGRTWLVGKALVIAAADNRCANARVSRDAQKRNIWVNVVDDPALSNFQVPAIVDRSPLVVAVSSAGAAPVLARRARERLESLFDDSWGSLARIAQQYRSQIKAHYPDVAARRRFYDWMLDGPVAACVRQSRIGAAESCVEQALAGDALEKQGSVTWVGAGPGGSGLFTLKGLRALNEADLVVYESAVNPEIIGLGRRDADKLAWADGCFRQGGADRAYALLIDQARQGLRVVYLFAGADFADRSLRMAQFAGQGVQCEWVPGVGGEAPAFA
jgi:uroporphyrin-III C-methyltransferase/precorrin-2 dehydrogenase/sirohydrochlorin ferrochelatase